MDRQYCFAYLANSKGIQMIMEPRKDSRTTAALLNLVTVGGGTGGMTSCLPFLLQDVGKSLKDFFAVLLIFTAYFLGVFGGTIQNADFKKGRRLIATYLVLQVPVLNTSLMGFKFFALGAYAVIFHPAPVTFEFQWYIGSDWNLSLLHKVADAGIGINLIPLVIINALRVFQVPQPLQSR